MLFVFICFFCCKIKTACIFILILCLCFLFWFCFFGVLFFLFQLVPSTTRYCSDESPILFSLDGDVVVGDGRTVASGCCCDCCDWAWAIMLSSVNIVFIIWLYVCIRLIHMQCDTVRINFIKNCHDIWYFFLLFRFFFKSPSEYVLFCPDSPVRSKCNSAFRMFSLKY